MRRTRLVIADRHPIVLQGLTSVFAAHRDFEIVASCRDGAGCVEAIRNLAPDVALLEDSLPDVTASEILAIANAENLSTRLVFFTASVEHGDLAAAIAAGACSAISKYASPETLLQSLRLVAEGISLLPEPSPDLAPTGKEVNARQYRKYAGRADGPRARNHASGVRRLVEQSNCAPAEHFSRHHQSAPPPHISEA